MSKFTKITAFAAPVIMALAVAAPSEAKILLMGDGGWEVSFDGSVNTFYSHMNKDKLSKADTAAFANHTGAAADGENTSRVTVGLLPAVWGMNVKAPTTNGLDMAARIGLYPSTQNNRRKNTSNAATGGQHGANLDLRQIFFTVDGGFGQVLVGRTLGLFQSKNILTSMTLFGVGWGAGEGAKGGTTLGRTGAGYVTPNFNAALRYTTPDFNGAKATVAVYDPSTVGGGTGNLKANPARRRDATKTKLPRLEAELSYAGNVNGVAVSAWASGMYQKAKRTGDEVLAACADPSNAVPGSGAAKKSCGVKSGVTVGAGAGGLQVGYGGLTLTGSGYMGKGLGMAVMIDKDALDAKGQTRSHHGYIAQGVYAFGQGTSIGASYGESRASETNTDRLQRASVTVAKKSVSLLDFMVWHDINKNLRVVGEYGRQEVKWHDGVKQPADTVSIGGFFFW